MFDENFIKNVDNYKKILVYVDNDKEFDKS